MSEKQFDINDERFKEAAAEFEPPFDEASWSKLEAMLDADKKRRRPFAWWWLGDAFIIAMLAYIIYSIAPATTKTLKEDGTFKNSSTATTNVDNKSNQHAMQTNGQQNQPAVPTQPKAKDVVGGSFKKKNQKSLYRANPISVGSNEKTRSTTPGTDLENAVIPGTKEKKHPKQEVVSAGNSLETNSPDEIKKEDGTVNNLPASPSAEVVASEGKTIVQSSEPAIEVAIETTESSSIITEPDKLTESQETITVAGLGKPSSSLSASKKGFFIYGSLAPEWSFAAGNQPGAATLAWGLGVGYRLSKKWAVQAGYFSTKKLYEAGPGDYQAKPGTYYYNLTIKQVYADCRITEIPIMLTYTIQEGKRQAIYASAGLSSLIMKEENYQYNYLRANQTPAYASYTYKTHNSHLFSSMLLSAGYGVKLNKSLSVKAEPYLKIPLYGVGEGSIKIYSFGIMTGVQYNLPSLRKK